MSSRARKTDEFPDWAKDFMRESQEWLDDSRKRMDAIFKNIPKDVKKFEWWKITKS